MHGGFYRHVPIDLIMLIYNKSINSDSQFNELLQAEKASKIYFDIEYDLPSNDTELLSNEITYFFQYCL